MKTKITSGFIIRYGKRRNRPGLVGWITDSSLKLGKTAYFSFKCVEGDRDDLLIAMGQELRYLEMNEVDPTIPFKGKTVEIEV